ncbi:hypothetical protein Adt_24100 [Abeliophyllum distichum]|uniref:Uncharacterized protein n=1 Tax=Abeliophyllum distichum TaxID=126358 RepID=A0ABD1SCQ6_9LAMI
MDIAPLFGIFLTTPSLPPSILVYWRTPPVRSYKVNVDGCVKDGFASALFWRLSSGLFLMVSFLLRGLYYQIYGLSPTLLLSFTASLEVEDLDLFRPLFVTLDISLHLTIILFLIFIARATRWLTYLLQRIGIVVVILSTTLKIYYNVTTT